MELVSDLHIAGVGRTAALVDRCIELDAHGRAYIPSTAFKGRVRAHDERLMHALGYEMNGCKPPAPLNMCQVWLQQNGEWDAHDPQTPLQHLKEASHETL
ncbi:MAG: hypothetical protein ACK4ME_02785 [Fimbriimonadales bacterium]